jgi:subtilisin family serine protease
MARAASALPGVLSASADPVIRIELIPRDPLYSDDSTPGANFDPEASGYPPPDWVPGIDAYSMADGTSFAAPLVSGYLGLVLSYNPCAKPDDLRAALHNSAVDIGAAGGYDVETGYGRLQMTVPDLNLDCDPWDRHCLFGPTTGKGLWPNSSGRISTVARATASPVGPALPGSGGSERSASAGAADAAHSGRWTEASSAEDWAWPFNTITVGAPASRGLHQGAFQP